MGFRGGVLATFLLGLVLAACGDPTPSPIPAAVITATLTARPGQVTSTISSTSEANPTSGSLVPTKGLAGGKLKEVFPSLANLTAPGAISSIYVNDSWNGLNRAAPLVSRLCLLRQPGGFEGRALYTAGHEASGQFNTGLVERTGQVRVPETEINRFLQLVSELPVKEGVYKPKTDHTDDYPNLLVELKGLAGLLKLFSQSQGGERVPWGLTFNNRTFVINTAEPEKAYQVLEFYFNPGKIQQELIKEVEQKLKAPYTPGPSTTVTRPLFPGCEGN